MVPPIVLPSICCRTLIEYPQEHMKITKLITYCLLMVFVCGLGCTTSKPTPDPLTGFHEAFKAPAESIGSDYHNYMQNCMRNLSTEEIKNLGPYPASFFEGDMGQHAIKIKIGMKGDSWVHILIYDKDNRRVKTFKYVAGHYRS